MELGDSVDGTYIFTPSEWVQLQRWFYVVIMNMTRRQKHREDVDGKRLLRVGRERWSDPETRDAAMANARAVPSVWLGYGMWVQ